MRHNQKNAGKNNINITLFKLKHHLIYKWLPLSLVYRFFIPKGNDIEIAYIEGFTTKLLSESTNKKAKKYAWVHCNIQIDHWTKKVYKNETQESDCYKKYNKIIAVAQSVEEAIKNTFPENAHKVETIYNPIDEQAILNLGKERIEYPKKDDKIRLVTVGRIVSQKGYDRLVRIIKRLKEDGFNHELWIIGTGTQINKIKQFITNNSLEEYIKLLGFQSNPYKYLSKGDLFVCSSRSEGYSTAVTEALILGLPIVTTDCSGMKELLKNGECGIITPNDEDSLYLGIKKILSNKNLLDYYKIKSEERGKDFSVKKLITPIEELLLL